MWRLILCGTVSWLALGSSARADDAEDKAIAYVKKVGGRVTPGANKASQPATGIQLFGPMVTDTGLKNLTPLKGLTTLVVTLQASEQFVVPVGPFLYPYGP